MDRMFSYGRYRSGYSPSPIPYLYPSIETGFPETNERTRTAGRFVRSPTPYPHVLLRSLRESKREDSSSDESVVEDVKQEVVVKEEGVESDDYFASEPSPWCAGRSHQNARTMNGDAAENVEQEETIVKEEGVGSDDYFTSESSPSCAAKRRQETRIENGFGAKNVEQEDIVKMGEVGSSEYFASESSPSCSAEKRRESRIEYECAEKKVEQEGIAQQEEVESSGKSYFYVIERSRANALGSGSEYSPPIFFASPPAKEPQKERDVEEARVTKSAKRKMDAVEAGVPEDFIPVSTPPRPEKKPMAEFDVEEASARKGMKRRLDPVEAGENFITISTPPRLKKKRKTETGAESASVASLLDNRETSPKMTASDATSNRATQTPAGEERETPGDQAKKLQEIKAKLHESTMMGIMKDTQIAKKEADRKILRLEMELDELKKHLEGYENIQERCHAVLAGAILQDALASVIARKFNMGDGSLTVGGMIAHIQGGGCFHWIAKEIIDQFLKTIWGEPSTQEE
ncbi:hypothetical protein PHISCL_01206 [Aspergillus sclerotialis]|uniref:Uncharacterized protein n=1 Tax=Aspergillus sclerotialis TaxID=2070753 RepID=A0A3A2ZTU4_9EURO|nr:hypothetical protein PHISCL_01206 [Aspergillus sclerotialis]